MMKNLPRSCLHKSPPLLTLAHCVSPRWHHSCLGHSSGVLFSSLSYTFPSGHCCIFLEEALRIPLWAHSPGLKDLENAPLQPALKKAGANVAKEVLCLDKHQVIEMMCREECRPLPAALKKVSLYSWCLPASGNPGAGRQTLREQP